MSNTNKCETYKQFNYAIKLNQTKAAQTPKINTFKLQRKQANKTVSKSKHNTKQNTPQTKQHTTQNEQHTAQTKQHTAQTKQHTAQTTQSNINTCNTKK